MPGMHPTSQSPVPIPHYSPSVNLSDSDIMRIAMQLKTLLKEDIEETVKTKVALAAQPLQNQLNFVQSELNTVRSELETLKDSIEKANIKNDDLEQYS